MLLQGGEVEGNEVQVLVEEEGVWGEGMEGWEGWSLQGKVEGGEEGERLEEVVQQEERGIGGQGRPGSKGKGEWERGRSRELEIAL